jgi:hypothetical protein
MSEGPIKQWRDSQKPPRVSTANVDRVCMSVGASLRSYCGRRSPHVSHLWDAVTCADCQAAHRADQEVSS